MKKQHEQNLEAFNLHYDIKELFIDALGEDDVKSIGTNTGTVYLKIGNWFMVGIESTNQAKLMIEKIV